MSDMAIVFAILGIDVVLFATDRIAVEIVTLGVALSVALSVAATGVLDIDQALAGFRDRWVIFMVIVAAPRPNAGSRPSATRRRRPLRRHDRQLDRRPVGR